MWLLIVFIAAIITTAIWYKYPESKYKLGLLSSLLWGATIMWFVDHAYSFFKEGGKFIEISWAATLLGIIVVLAAIVIWGFALFLSARK